MNKYGNFIAVIIGILISVVLGELFSGLYLLNVKSTKYLNISKNLNLGYEHKPSVEFMNRHGIKIKYNSLGFIGGEINPAEESIKILGVGDSIIEGTYLPENKRCLNILGVLLENKLKRKIEVLNGGVGGYNSRQQLELLKEKALLIKLDLVIVGICLNDFVNIYPKVNDIFGIRVFSLRDGSKARYFNFLYQRSNIYKLLYDLASNLRRGLYDEKGYQNYLKEHKLDIKSKDLEGWEGVYLNMVSFAKKHNINILFVTFPLETKVLRQEEDSFKPLSDFFKKENVYFLDLIDEFKKEFSLGNTLFRKRDIIHPSALGHKIAAEEIAKFIINNNILGNP